MKIIPKSKRSEMTPVVKTSIIIGSLVVAMLVVIVVVYNIVGSSVDEKRAEEAVDLTIIKNSVALEGSILTLSLSGELGEKKLNKVKFLISDGVNEEELTLDASGFEAGKQHFKLDLGGLGIDYSKKLFIGVVPIIKTLTGEKTLSLREGDKISVSPSGDVEQEETEEKTIITEIKECSKCGLLCSEIKCHSISQGCYYDGGFTKKCIACSVMTCSKYNIEADCFYDRCLLDCEWNKNKCIKDPVCGDGDCTGSENYIICSKDCDAPECSVEGATRECGIAIGSCKKGTQNCSNGIWGQCGGTYVGPSDEKCNNLDDDCNSKIDDGLIAPLNDNQVGVCNSSTKVCVGASSWQNSYTGISKYESTEISCSDGLDNDCDGRKDIGCTLANGAACSNPSQCTSGYCAPDGVCCNDPCTGVCKTCATGICTIALAGTDHDEDCGTTACGLGYCKGGVAQCAVYSSGQKGSCPTCQYCNGEDSNCGYVNFGTDPFGECPLHSACESGLCVAGGPSGTSACFHVSVVSCNDYCTAPERGYHSCVSGWISVPCNNNIYKQDCNNWDIDYCMCNNWKYDPV